METNDSCNNPALVLALMMSEVDEASVTERNRKAIQGAKEVALDTYLLGSPGKAIEAQEARAQEEMLTWGSTTAKLPRKGPWDKVEIIGIKPGVEVDDLFREVELPAGWEIRGSDHAMWTYLYDDKGRERASIFYKGAFYDRSAHFSLKRRYLVDRVFQDDEKWCGPRKSVVKDNCTGEIVFETDWSPGCQDYEDRDALRADTAIHQRHEDEAEAWLKEHFPDYQDSTAYWD